MPLIATRGAASAQGFGEFAQSAGPVYIEDVFSTFLYTGTGATQTITNGISTGNITAFATTSNTTASSIRSGSTLAGFFGSQGVFASFSAGQYLLVDYGTDTAVTQATYRNTVDAPWAPTQVLIQSSPDNSTWTTRATYSDDGSTNLQTITVSGGASARYWRLYQNTATRQNQAGYEWHFGSFTMVATTASANGGMVWIKRRNTSGNNVLFDTSRGAGYTLVSNATDASSLNTSTLTSFTTSGFTLSTSALVNTASDTYASWTFREQPKFFDVVTYTGNNSSQTISHNLGSVPGCIIVKCVGGADPWFVYHRSLGTSQYLILNSTDGSQSSTGIWNPVTSTTFNTSSALNANGLQYVAYLFAHNAGGFGAAGTDNVISCGSFTYSAGTTIDLGYEPQWLLIKRTDAAQDWFLVDVLRGWTTSSTSTWFAPNAANAESALGALGVAPTATGFRVPTGYGNGATIIYIAIRRGPMRPPSTGTSVFGVTTNTDAVSSTSPLTTVPEAIDLLIDGARTSGVLYALPRLTQWDHLVTSSTAGETGYLWSQPAQNKMQPSSGWFGAGTSQINWMFKRAPGFFDVVCYAGNGSTQSVSHNLTVAPELIIVKWRNDGGTAYGWRVYQANLGITKWGQFTNDAFTTASVPYPWDTPTSSVFKLGDGATWLSINGSNRNFIAYLFATVPGVSKVGSYTGTGTTQTINCGFTAGSRFVMIKRTDSTGDWYVWDSARGIVAGNDPYLLLNSAVPEVTNTDYVDTANSGFEISSTAPAAINANGGTFIFLAIA
jgi:hypothetical protein